MEDWAARSGGSLSNVVSQDTQESDNLNQVFARLTDRDVGRYRGASPAYLQGGKLIDPWGTPYNISWFNDLDARSSARGKPQSQTELVVWSSGPNKTNEYGNGDDVVLPEPQITPGN